VRNVTISLPEATLEALREKAQANGKSLNAWLRELLSREVQADSGWADEVHRLSDRCAEMVREANPEPWTWSREEIYEERLRRH
jgi:hypothetical protein